MVSKFGQTGLALEGCGGGSDGSDGGLAAVARVCVQLSNARMGERRMASLDLDKTRAARKEMARVSTEGDLA